MNGSVAFSVPNIKPPNQGKAKSAMPIKNRLFLILIAFLLGAGGKLKAQSDWQLVNLEGRDYVTLDNIAHFYQLESRPTADGQRLMLSDSQVRIETLTNSRELYVNGVKEWLAFPILNKDGQLLVSRFDLAKTIEPCLRPAMIGNLTSFHTVVLDAGHGGQDGGGNTTTGQEKEYTLDVVRDLKRALEAKGLNVVLTRADDVYLPLEQRADFANTIPDAVFVSVHFNSGESSANGLEVYAMTPQGVTSTSDSRSTLEQFKPMPGNDFDNASLALANSVHHAVLGRLGVADRGVRRARFAVLRLTHSPAILVEGGFMTSGLDSHDITDTTWRQRLADAIGDGVMSYQNLVQHRQPPKLLAEYRREQPDPARANLAPMVLATRGPVPQVDTTPPVDAKPLRPRSELIVAPAARTSATRPGHRHR